MYSWATSQALYLSTSPFVFNFVLNIHFTLIFFAPSHNVINSQVPFFSMTLISKSIVFLHFELVTTFSKDTGSPDEVNITKLFISSSNRVTVYIILHSWWLLSCPPLNMTWRIVFSWFIWWKTSNSLFDLLFFFTGIFILLLLWFIFISPLKNIMVSFFNSFTPILLLVFLKHNVPAYNNFLWHKII